MRFKKGFCALIVIIGLGASFLIIDDLGASDWKGMMVIVGLGDSDLIIVGWGGSDLIIVGLGGSDLIIVGLGGSDLIIVGLEGSCLMIKGCG